MLAQEFSRGNLPAGQPRGFLMTHNLFERGRVFAVGRYVQLVEIGFMPFRAARVVELNRPSLLAGSDVPELEETLVAGDQGLAIGGERQVANVPLCPL